MMNLPNFSKMPKLPDKEELEYKEKEFFLSLYEQFQRSSKIVFISLAVAVVLAVPLTFGLKYFLTKSLISAYKPPTVNTIPYTPQDLEILKVQVLPVTTGASSIVAQVVNPNAEISVRNLNYEFVLKDSGGAVLKTVSGQDYLLARESKFIVEPQVIVSEEVASAEMVLGKTFWTLRKPIEVQLQILQKNSGQTPEGNFFVEGLVKNPEGFGFKKVEVWALVFDSPNQNIIAVNETILTDLRPFESRYFRMIWPKNYANTGEVQVTATLNALDPGLFFEEGQPVPVR